ncbi:phage holin family protein [Ferribacterium limneticum]|uniref:phage holin family protein n=1 Tax=Ferribacterium limneticum TaxID=76259 RepID=UPI001CF96136|nr:phage holin family protein [Ferribacterium limneticum]UCV28665.1 phage holin family protein [Ferribacterium limneticum]UCV32582.1 phage holin family protein [Ferribacterium limneticum]
MTQQSGGEGGREGLFSALKNIVATLIAIGKTRAELLVTELEEEKFRLMSLWAKAIGAAFLLALGVVMVVCCVALAFWEQRVVVFGIFAVLFIGGGAILVGSLKRQASQPSKMFKSSLSELEADMAQLRRYRNKSE